MQMTGIEDETEELNTINTKQFGRLLDHLRLLKCEQTCDHTFQQTAKWLKKRKANLSDNIGKLLDLHANCDCEVFIYIEKGLWRDQHNEPLKGPIIHGEEKWRRTVLDALREARVPLQEIPDAEEA